MELSSIVCEVDDVCEPQRLLCPITHVMYWDPVVIRSGNTYERSAIVAYWRRQKQLRDPLQNTPLPDGTMISNWEKRRDVQDFLANNLEYVPEGWESREVVPPVRQCDQYRQASAMWPFAKYAAAVVVGAALTRRIQDSGMEEPFPPSPDLGNIFAMQQFPALTTAQEQGCDELARHQVWRTNRTDVVGEHGVGLILSAIGEHVTSTEVQSVCCEALSQFAFRPQNVDIILARGGIELLLRVMSLHADAVELQTCVCKVLGMLLRGWVSHGWQPSAHEKIALLGGVELVINAMLNHNQSSELAAHGSRLLERLGLADARQTTDDALGYLSRESSATSSFVNQCLTTWTSSFVRFSGNIMFAALMGGLAALATGMFSSMTTHSVRYLGNEEPAASVLAMTLAWMAIAFLMSRSTFLMSSSKYDFLWWVRAPVLLTAAFISALLSQFAADEIVFGQPHGGERHIPVNAAIFVTLNGILHACGYTLCVG